MSESLPSSSDKLQEGISRRSFLKKSGGAVIGGATLAGNLTGVLEERAAQATEVLEGMSWSEGAQKFREDVMNSTVETSAIFVEHSDRSYWTYPGDEEARSTKRDPRTVISRERDKGASHIKRAHTHTLSDAKTLVEGGGDIEAWKSGRDMPRLAPSVDDVRATAVLSYSFPDIKFEEQAFDPYGSWSIFFDGNNAFGKDIVELKEAERLLSISKKQLQDHFGDTWRTEFERMAGDENYAVELFGDTRGRIVYDLASRAVRLDNRFQNEYNPILQELDVLRRELLEASVGGLDTEVIAAKYCSVAERIGARVAFVSYDELI